jgi:excisionase family DNA binding protein
MESANPLNNTLPVVDPADWAGDNLISILGVQARLQLSAMSIYNLTKSGALPSFKIGRRRFVTAADLKAFIEARRSA